MGQRSLALIKTETDVFTISYHNKYGKDLAIELATIRKHFPDFTRENIITFLPDGELEDNFFFALENYPCINDGVLVVDCTTKEYAFVNPDTRFMDSCYSKLIKGKPYPISEAIRANKHSIDFDAEFDFTVIREKITNKFLENFNKVLVS